MAAGICEKGTSTRIFSSEWYELHNKIALKLLRKWKTEERLFSKRMLLKKECAYVSLSVLDLAFNVYTPYFKVLYKTGFCAHKAYNLIKDICSEFSFSKNSFLRWYQLRIKE